VDLRGILGAFGVLHLGVLKSRVGGRTRVSKYNFGVSYDFVKCYLLLSRLVNAMRALMAIIEKFGAELIKNAQQILELAKSILVNSQADENSIILALGLLKTVLMEGKFYSPLSD
jgi:hypothetical protein